MTRRDIGRPRRRNLDKDKLTKLAQSLGFKVEEVKQPWRHAVIFGQYQGNPAVLKIASTQKTNSHTQNEYDWNEAFWQIMNIDRQPIVVPKNLHRGWYEDRLFYFVMTRFVGDPLVAEKSTDVSRISKRVDDIAIAAKTISQLPIPETSQFYKNHQKADSTYLKNLIIDSAKTWARYAGEDCSQYLKEIEKYLGFVEMAPQHGDFSPRQLYEVDGKIGVIDGEHASSQGPKHYDAAWFFIRMYFDHDNPPLAQIFLKSYFSLWDDPKKEWQAMKPVLLQKLIGDLWGAGEAKKRRVHELAHKALSNITPLFSAS